MAVVLGAGAGVWIAGFFWGFALLSCFLSSRVPKKSKPIFIAIFFALLIIPIILIVLALYGDTYPPAGPVVYEYLTHVRRALIVWAVLMLLLGLGSVFVAHIVEPIHAKAIKID